MIEEAITRAEAFSVMYTPFATKIRPDKIEKVKEVFVKTHPAYVDCIYTGKFLTAQLADAVPPWQPAQGSAAVATSAGLFAAGLLLRPAGVSFNLKSSNVSLFLRL